MICQSQFNFKEFYIFLTNFNNGQFRGLKNSIVGEKQRHGLPGSASNINGKGRASAKGVFQRVQKARQG